MSKLAKIFGAELIGTAMVTAGPIAWGVWKSSGGVGTLLDAAIVSALPVLLGIFLFRTTSSQFNPAVTLWLWMTGRLSRVDAVSAVAGQITGAIGIAMLLRTVSTVPIAGMTVPHVPVPAAVIVEFALTLGLLGIIRKVAVTSPDDYGKDTPAVIIAAGVVGLIVLGGPYTDASMNPARSLGPAIAAGHGTSIHQLVYWLGPLLASAVMSAYDKFQAVRNPR
ncbi:MAG: Aquaporin 2 [Armatimonadota bacterium]|jgi:glycerol uptake facilitator-like aquaporin